MKQRSLFSKPKSKDLPPKPVSKPAQSKPVTRPTYKNNPVEKNERFTQPFLEKAKLTNPDDIEIYDKIQRNRLRILVWSRMYYRMSTQIVDDRVFDRVGAELVELQAKYPEISKIVAYAEEFEDWDASTGFHLPLDDPWVCHKANQILGCRPDRRK